MDLQLAVCGGRALGWRQSAHTAQQVLALQVNDDDGAMAISPFHFRQVNCSLISAEN